MTLNADRTVSTAIGDELEVVGNCKLENAKIIITSSEISIGNISADFDGSSFVIEMMGTTIVYTKI